MLLFLDQFSVSQERSSWSRLLGLVLPINVMGLFYEGNYLHDPCLKWNSYFGLLQIRGQNIDEFKRTLHIPPGQNEILQAKFLFQINIDEFIVSYAHVTDMSICLISGTILFRQEKE